MSALIDKLEQAQLRKVPQFDPGDRVRVHFQVIEGSRRRTQVFEGFVIKRQGSGLRETFTVRKQSFGVGVERTFPVHSPKIEQIEVAARGEVRRAKLYYLRDRIGKAARVRERAWSPQDAQGSIEDAELVAPVEEEPTAQEDSIQEDSTREESIAPTTEEATTAGTDSEEAATAETEAEPTTPQQADTQPEGEAAPETPEPEAPEPETPEPEAGEESPADEATPVAEEAATDDAPSEAASEAEEKS